MIDKYFKIDFKKKIISYNPKGATKTFTARQLYSFLQDTFDKPENMKYDIPIIAKNKDNFELLNGWTVDKKGIKFLKGGTLLDS